MSSIDAPSLVLVAYGLSPAKGYICSFSRGSDEVAEVSLPSRPNLSKPPQHTTRTFALSRGSKKAYACSFSRESVETLFLMSEVPASTLNPLP